MLNFLTDAKNFAVGGISGGADRAGNWGRWAFGYNGDSFDHSMDRRGQFSHFRIGGGLAVSLMAAAVGGIAMLPVAYFGILLTSVALGGITGMLSGGMAEMGEGRDRRHEAENARAQERDQAKLQQLANQRDKLGAKANKTRDKIGAVQDKMQNVKTRMQERSGNNAPKGGFAEREMQRRAATANQTRGK